MLVFFESSAEEGSLYVHHYTEQRGDSGEGNCVSPHISK